MAEDNDGEITVHRIQDTEKTTAHVRLCLKVIEQCARFLIVPTGIERGYDVNQAAAEQAQKTLELAQFRMRNLLDDESRWTMSPTASERDSSSLVAATLKLYDAKTKNARILNRPCLYLRPQLKKFPDIGWCAWVGGALPARSDLHGTGTTPQAAMEAFDKAYSQEAHIANSQPKVSETPAKPTRKKKKHAD